MKNNTTYQISTTLRAELTDDNYLLTVFNDSLDDYDTYKLENGEWVQNFDSLSNKDEAAGEIWDDAQFAAWADGIKAAANA